jgi:hypothetical protein
MTTCDSRNDQRDDSAHGKDNTNRDTSVKGNVDFQDMLGRQLKAVYNQVMDEPPPDRFAELLKKLAEKDGEPKS